jgi:polysaccharide export outer membrane protein
MKRVAWIRLRSTFVTLVACTLTACNGPIAVAPTQPSDDAAFAPPSTIELPGLPEDPAVETVLLPGDVLRIRTISVAPIDWSDLTIDSAGRLHLPLAGDVEVGGLGLTEAEARVEAAMQRYDLVGRVSLAITRTSGHRATVVGAVSRPGVYEISPAARLAEVVALAGGPRTAESEGETYELADLDGARLMRGGTPLPVSLIRALAGDLRHNVLLHAGDLLYLPPARGQRIVILGDVQSPKVTPYRPGMRLSEALAIGGGLTREADSADVRVVRGPLSRPRVYRADVKALFAAKAPDVVLAPGDVVFVTEHWFATATGIVNRLTPALAAAAVTSTLLKR